MVLKYDIIVIGGGAAGLMAAGHAAELGSKVLLLEKMQHPGRKLGITGKGRCNITNTSPLQEFIQKINPNGEFLNSTFSVFFSDELIKFMNNIGVRTTLERGKRVFPENGKAVEVVKKMVFWCKRKSVRIKINCKVESLILKDKKVIGVSASENGRETTFYSDKIIIASGGVSYPKTGSTGDGYKLAESVGHTINNVAPSLVPLEAAGNIAGRLDGLELKNINATVLIDNEKVVEDFGEMIFRDSTITGPVILTLSRIIVPALKQNKKVEIIVDLKPALGETKLDNRLLREFDKQSKENFRTILNKLLPKILIPICISQSRISKHRLGNEITPEERKRLLYWLKNFRIRILGHRDFDEAIITAGGIDTEEINQKTMASKLIEGIYFAGEIIDLDGPTGGYNLQIAFSTAWVAAEAACC
ncbi:MAG: NAD(P)/FAD-dependent oxidoreductase [Bacteroidales bacterium]|nr:NAD(P)/FAD-dependent oxidoreductase [Bacteroidales bacterium]